MKKVSEKNLEDINISEQLLNKLKEHNLHTVKEVWELSRSDLKELGFNNNEIKNIVIKLELLGLDLNKKIY